MDSSKRLINVVITETPEDAAIYTTINNHFWGTVVEKVHISNRSCKSPSEHGTSGMLFPHPNCLDASSLGTKPSLMTKRSFENQVFSSFDSLQNTLQSNFPSIRDCLNSEGSRRISAKSLHTCWDFIYPEGSVKAMKLQTIYMSVSRSQGPINSPILVILGYMC